MAARRRHHLFLLTLVALGATAPPSLHAQGTARSLDIDPSVRSAGMGGASNAVFWGDPNPWANPALIALTPGLRFEWSRTQLLPGLADDVVYESRTLAAGAMGAYFLLAGEPFEGLGGQRVSFGTSEGADDQGIPFSFEGFEDIDSWGFGVSAAQLTRAAFLVAGSEPPGALDRFDVAFGMRTKRFEMDFAPGPSGSGGGTARDRGVLIRVTPYDGIGEPGALPLRVDAGYGWSDLSYDEPRVTFVGDPQSFPISRHHRHGLSLRFSGGQVPPGIAHGLSRLGWGWLTPGLSPLVSIGWAFDQAHITADGSDYDTRGLGLEIALANVLTMRTGWYRDREGNIDDMTWGLGVGLPLGDIAGVRWDYGRSPNPEDSEIEDDRGHAVTAFLDPVAMWQWWRRPPGTAMAPAVTPAPATSSTRAGS